MKVTSKNKVTLEINPENPWNPLDWCCVLRSMWQIKHSSVYVNTKDWKITYRTMTGE